MARFKLLLAVLAVGLILALALALALKFVVFAPQRPSPSLEIELKPLKPELVAKPGEFITQVVNLTYKGEEAVRECIPSTAEESLILSLEVPDNWQVLGLDGVNPITLRLGGSRQVFITIGIPPLYPPGEYPLSLKADFSWAPVRIRRISFQSPSSEPESPVCVGPALQATTSFTVRVGAAAIPKVEPLSPRAEVDLERGLPVPIFFKVTNQGNRRGAFKLEVTGPSGWVVLWGRPKGLKLSPGESKKVGVLVRPSRGAATGVEEIVLKAKAEGYEAEAKLKVTILPH